MNKLAIFPIITPIAQGIVQALLGIVVIPILIICFRVLNGLQDTLKFISLDFLTTQLANEPRIQALFGTLITLAIAFFIIGFIFLIAKKWNIGEPFKYTESIPIIFRTIQVIFLIIAFPLLFFTIIGIISNVILAIFGNSDVFGTIVNTIWLSGFLDTSAYKEFLNNPQPFNFGLMEKLMFSGKYEIFLPLVFSLIILIFLFLVIFKVLKAIYEIAILYLIFPFPAYQYALHDNTNKLNLWINDIKERLLVSSITLFSLNFFITISAIFVRFTNQQVGTTSETGIILISIINFIAIISAFWTTLTLPKLIDKYIFNIDPSQDNKQGTFKKIKNETVNLVKSGGNPIRYVGGKFTSLGKKYGGDK